MTNQRNKLQPVYRKQLIKKFGGQCTICNSKQNLQFHHTKETKLNGRGRGKKEQYYDILNNPDCYQLICKECHRKLHS